MNLWTDLSPGLPTWPSRTQIEADYAPDVDPDKKKISSWQYDLFGAEAYKSALMHYMNVFGCVDKA